MQQKTYHEQALKDCKIGKTKDLLWVGNIRPQDEQNKKTSTDRQQKTYHEKALKDLKMRKKKK